MNCIEKIQFEPNKRSGRRNKPCNRCGIVPNAYFGRRVFHIDKFGKIIEFSKDHIVPRARFPKGTSHHDNIQVLCVPCNLMKSDKSEGKAILEFMRLRLAIAQKTVEALK